MDKPLYKCECGYVTHFEKALLAHCRFRGHKPLEEKKPAEIKAVKTAEKAEAKKPRKPRTKKTVATKE